MAELEIPDLPLITDLSLDDIIPAVQEGMAGHAQLSTLLALMFSNISRVENANGESYRIPLGASGGLQVCFHLHEFYPTAAEFSLAPAAPWPQAFPANVKPVPFLSSVEGSTTGDLHSITNARAARYIYRDNVTATNYRIMVYARSGDTLEATKPVRTGILGIGRY